MEGKYGLKSLEILGSLFSWEGWEQKEGTECSHKLSQENNMVRLRRYTCGRNVFLRSRHSREILGTRCVSLINSHCLHVWQREKGNEYEQGGLMSFLLCSSGAPFCCIPQLRHYCSTRSCLAYNLTQASVGWFCHWFSLEVTVTQKPFVFSELSKFPPPVSWKDSKRQTIRLKQKLRNAYEHLLWMCFTAKKLKNQYIF